MPDQARNTTLSLTHKYQHDVDPDDYEVILVENESESMMDPSYIETLPSNFRYIQRQESEPTPTHAMNYGAKQALGENVCMMVDGARMVTPGVVNALLMAHRLHPAAVVTVPGYHIGDELQQDAVDSGLVEPHALTQSDDL